MLYAAYSTIKIFCNDTISNVFCQGKTEKSPKTFPRQILFRRQKTLRRIPASGPLRRPLSFRGLAAVPQHPPCSCLVRCLKPKISLCQMDTGRPASSRADEEPPILQIKYSCFSLFGTSPRRWKAMLRQIADTPLGMILCMQRGNSNKGLNGIGVTLSGIARSTNDF